MFSPGFVIQYFVSFWFCNHLDGKRGHVALWCSVALSRGVVG